MQALEEAWGHLSQGVLCLWHGEHGPEGEMYELCGPLLLTPWTLAPQKQAQFEGGPLTHGSQGKHSVAWVCVGITSAFPF